MGVLCANVLGGAEAPKCFSQLLRIIQEKRLFARKGTSEDTAKTGMASDEREMKADLLPKGETRTNFKNPMHLGACFSLLFEYRL